MSQVIPPQMSVPSQVSRLALSPTVKMPCTSRGKQRQLDGEGQTREISYPPPYGSGARGSVTNGVQFRGQWCGVGTPSACSDCFGSES
jgi:hypothetical protein